MRAASFLLVFLALLAGAYADETPADAPPADAPPADTQPAAPAGLRDIRQVQIQVLISETNDKGVRDIGANLDYTRFVRGVEQSGSLQQVSTNLFSPQGDFGGVTMPVPDQTVFNPPLRPDEDNNLATGIQAREGFGLTASVISPGYGTVEGVFRAAERKSDVEIVSKPEVLVMNQGTATIQAGGEVPYQSLDYDVKGMAQLGIEFQPVGANLTIVPTILSNNMIQLHLQQLDVSEVARIDNLRGIDLPVFSKRSQTGFVTVPNGQTLVIGGLNSRVVRKSERHLPVIGAVPILGIPFRARKSEVTFSHLLIFVTPTVVDLRDMGDDARSALEFWRTRSGDYQYADRIDQEVAVMQDE